MIIRSTFGKIVSILWESIQKNVEKVSLNNHRISLKDIIKLLNTGNVFLMYLIHSIS
jgi:hypothetical protein